MGRQGERGRGMRDPYVSLSLKFLIRAWRWRLSAIRAQGGGNRQRSSAI